MPRWFKYFLGALLLLLAASIPLAMQLENGSIQGKITDGWGPVAAAAVECRNLSSGTIARATSDAAGIYKVENLRPGKYSLWIEAGGHDSVWIREVTVEPANIAMQDVFLRRTIPTD